MDKLDKIEAKVDKIIEKVEDINVTLASQHEVLKEHIRRTELIEEDMKPIKKHVTIVNALMKVLGLLISGGIITEIIVLLTKKN